jgi:VWFA-related protein
MCRRLALMFAAGALVSTVSAQSPGSTSSSTTPSLVLHSSAQLVVVDVVVQDEGGHPVHGLKPQDFQLNEAGVPQTLSHFEEHSSQGPSAPVRSLPPLPPGTFTDYTPIAPNSSLNILLIDALNTPLKDQAFVRFQLRQYVEHANPNTRIAVFGLANRLILLQGFTSDPAVLRDVVEHKLIPRSTSGEGIAGQQILSTEAASSAAPMGNGGPSAIDLAANLREFDAELGELETQLSVHYTLDAFNTLAHYLAAFPGRKNLVWFSGSFPLTVLPDASRAHPLDVENLDQTEFHETVDLLAKAQVAVYPIDARGLMTQPAFNASNPDTPFTRQVHNFNIVLSKFTQSQAAEHATMDELASGTGGKAFYNTNDLASAVSSAIASGTDYYTLSYTPTNTNQNGSFRPIRVNTNGIDTAQHLQLSYRRGYYTTDASHPPKPNQQQDSSAATPEEGRAAAYKQAAMSRGAPTPEDIVFKVRVLAAATTTETSAAPGNQLALSVPLTGPFRRYDLDYVSLPGELTFTQQPDGHHTAKVEFLAYVFDTEGRLLDETGRDVSIEATPANFAKLLDSVLRCHLELSVPDRVETFLRIGIRDVTSNKFGVIEIPASSVSSLPAATPGPAPTSGRATPPRD